MVEPTTSHARAIGCPGGQPLARPNAADTSFLFQERRLAQGEPAVHLGKPRPGVFFRAHVQVIDVAIVVVPGGRDRPEETFLVAPELEDEFVGWGLPGKRRIGACLIGEDGDLLIWPLWPPPWRGEHAAWGRSAWAAFEAATSRWTSVKADTESGLYNVKHPGPDSPVRGEPRWDVLPPIEQWPAVLPPSVVIDDMGHPAVRRLLAAAR
jgi:hypothetical protein